MLLPWDSRYVTSCVGNSCVLWQVLNINLFNMSRNKIGAARLILGKNAHHFAEFIVYDLRLCFCWSSVFCFRSCENFSIKFFYAFLLRAFFRARYGWLAEPITRVPRDPDTRSFLIPGFFLRVFLWLCFSFCGELALSGKTFFVLWIFFVIFLYWEILPGRGETLIFVSKAIVRYFGLPLLVLLYILVLDFWEVYCKVSFV